MNAALWYFALSIVDTAATAALVAVGHVEANPLVEHMLALGVVSYTMIKVSLAYLVVGLVALRTRKNGGKLTPPQRRIAAAVLALYAGNAAAQIAWLAV